MPAKERTVALSVDLTLANPVRSFTSLPGSWFLSQRDEKGVKGRLRMCEHVSHPKLLLKKRKEKRFLGSWETGTDRDRSHGPSVNEGVTVQGSGGQAAFWTLSKPLTRNKNL